MPRCSTRASTCAASPRWSHAARPDRWIAAARPGCGEAGCSSAEFGVVVDITQLRGPAKRSYYYLYVILDIFSRYVVGRMVALRESKVRPSG